MFTTYYKPLEPPSTKFGMILDIVMASLVIITALGFFGIIGFFLVLYISCL